MTGLENSTAILVRVAKFGKDYYLKVEAQGDYKNIGDVAREFTLKLKKGENLVGKYEENGLKTGLNEYFGINDKGLTHYYKKAGKVSYENPIVNEDSYSFVSLTNNKNMLIFPYNVGLKINENGKLIWFLWNLKRIQGFNFEVERKEFGSEFSLKPKNKGVSVAVIKGGERYLVENGSIRKLIFIDTKENEKDLFLFVGEYYANWGDYFIGYRLQPHYKYSHNRYMVDLDESMIDLLNRAEIKNLKEYKENEIKEMEAIIKQNKSVKVCK